LRNTRGFNTMIETHKVLVSLTNTMPAGVVTITNFTVGQAFAYQNTSTEVLSDTGELWRDWGRGVGLINTPRTQAAYGNLGIASQAFSTADCTFNISTPYAVVSLSSLVDAPISNSYHWLLTAAARAENYGQAANHAMTRITRTGAAPVMSEPVVGTLSARLGAGSVVMYPIRVNGTRGPAVPLAVTGGVATIDLKAEHQTIFYEITVIPEPGMIAMGLGLCLLGHARR